MNYLDNADWSFPVPIYYGPDRVRELPGFCKSNKLNRPLLVTDRSSADLPFVKNVLTDLNNSNLKCGLFTEIRISEFDIESDKVLETLAPAISYSLSL